jgi:hypothetical protein
MRVVWSTEVSLLVVTLYTIRQEFASEILTVSLHCVWRAIGIFAFPSTSLLWVSLQPFI